MFNLILYLFLLINSNNVILSHKHVSTVARTDTMYVEIAFSEPMSNIGLLNPNNYKIQDLTTSEKLKIYEIYSDYTIDGVKRDNILDTLLIKTSRHNSLGLYQLSVNNVKDVSGNLIGKNTLIYELRSN